MSDLADDFIFRRKVRALPENQSLRALDTSTLPNSHPAFATSDSTGRSKPPPTSQSPVDPAVPGSPQLAETCPKRQPHIASPANARNKHAQAVVVQLQAPIVPASATTRGPDRHCSTGQMPVAVLAVRNNEPAFAAASPKPAATLLLQTRPWVVRIVVIGAMVAIVWRSWSSMGLHSLVAKHANIDASIEDLQIASATLNTCCPVLPECVADVDTLLSRSVVLLDRDIRNAADAAVNGLGKTMQSFPPKGTGTQHGLTCSYTGHLVSRLDDVANQFHHVASRHKESLVHVGNATDQLRRAVSIITTERSVLEASRKDQLNVFLGWLRLWLWASLATPRLPRLLMSTRI